MTQHPRFFIFSPVARISTLVFAALAIALSVWLFLIEPWYAAARAIPVVWVLWIILWLLWWMPLLTIDRDTVTVRNAWRTHVINWNSILDADADFGLVLRVKDGTATRRIRCAAVQPRSGLRRRGAPEPLPFIDYSADSLSLHLDANQGAELFRTLMERRAHCAARVRLEVNDTPPAITSSLNVAPVIAVVVVIGAWVGALIAY